jgi:hypothetical protein
MVDIAICREGRNKEINPDKTLTFSQISKTSNPGLIGEIRHNGDKCRLGV